MDSETKKFIFDLQTAFLDMGREIKKLKTVVLEQEKKIEFLKKEVNGVHSYYGCKQ